MRPELYGTRTAESPRVAELIARGPDARLRVGLINLKERLILRGEDIDVALYDVTPSDGLDLELSDVDGDFADDVLVASIGDGRLPPIEDYFADVRPLLKGRDTARGTLRLTGVRVGAGEISHAGPRLEGIETAVDSNVWFRQRSFDLLVQPEFDELSTVADAQVLTKENGEAVFTIAEDIELQTDLVWPLNRRLAGVWLNGGRGFAFGVGTETDFLSFPFTYEGSEAGVTWPQSFPDRERTLVEEEERVRLPMILSFSQ